VPRTARRFASTSIALILLTGITTPGLLPARAAFPGANGMIAFNTGRDGDQEIYVMNADGSGQTRLTIDPRGDTEPVWSPDGLRIASQVNIGPDAEIFVMNADGSGQMNISNSPGTVDLRPAWSPDGTKIAFVSRPIAGNNDIWVMNADGSGRDQLTTDPDSDSEPAWSPDGTRIAFESSRTGNGEIFVMNAADGSGQTNITNHPEADGGPSWSPDGTRIAFESDRTGNRDIWVMNPDGTGLTNITNTATDEYWPAWSPSGTRLLFGADGGDGTDDIFVINADGSGRTNLTNFPGESEVTPDWQPLAPLSKNVKLKAKPKSAEAGEKVRLKAKVTPCEGHEGDVVEFYRKKKRIAKKMTNASCVAKLKVKVTKTSKFRAVSPEQDLDHLAGTSKPVKVNVES
jgi:Tol biopolymer transport system component